MMMKTVFFSLLALLSLDLIGVILLTIRADKLAAQVAQENRALGRRPARMDPISNTEEAAALTGRRKGQVCSVGIVHNQGARPSQQDNKCVESVFGGAGVLAVVADGMGGLSGGEKVSGRIVQDVHAAAPQFRPNTMDTILPQMVESICADINKMLGPEGIYKSGSTLLAVLSDGKKLTSFIGMGKLRYLSASRSSIAIAPGDRILLMSDGVFGTLSDQQMAEILTKCPDVTQAASLMENQVLAAQARGQDNFTAVILGF